MTGGGGSETRSTAVQRLGSVILECTESRYLQANFGSFLM